MNNFYDNLTLATDANESHGGRQPWVKRNYYFQVNPIDYYDPVKKKINYINQHTGCLVEKENNTIINEDETITKNSDVEKIDKNNMNVAILCYGRIDCCKKHYNNIIEKIGKHARVDFFMSCDNGDKNILNDFIDLYKPIKYTNEPIVYPRVYYNKNLCQPKGTNVNNVIRHFINKKRVFNLFEEYVNEENIKYDVIVSLRLDLFINDSFTFNVKNSTDKILYVPVGCDYEQNNGFKGLNDQIAYGNFITMKRYMSIIDNLAYLLQNNKAFIHPETLTYSNAVYMNLKIDRFELSYYIDK